MKSTVTKELLNVSKFAKLTVLGRLFHALITVEQKRNITVLLHLDLYNSYACIQDGEN